LLAVLVVQVNTGGGVPVPTWKAGMAQAFDVCPLLPMAVTLPP